MQEQVQRRTMVLDKEAVPHLLSVAVDWQRLVAEGVCGAKRHKLLDVLPGPDVIRRPGNNDRQFVRLDVRAALHLTTGLAGRIRTAREKKVGLSGCCVCGQDFAVHLVCRYMQEALQPTALARSLQK